MIMAALIEQVRLEFPTAIVPDTASYTLMSALCQSEYPTYLDGLP